MEGQFNARISRLERMKDSETEVPKPTAADAGKVVTVNQDGDGYVLGEGGGGSNLPAYSASDIGKVLTVDEGEGQSLPAEDFIPPQLLNFEDAGALLREIMVDEETFQRVVRATYSVDDGGFINLTPGTTPQGIHVLVSEDNNISIGYIERFGGWLITDESLSDGAHTISVSAILEGTPVLAWKGLDIGIPVLPTNDGRYALKILNGVASWAHIDYE